ncbi:MAG: biopolymer transporter ExbD [Chitinispirillaceae bacterium]|nr:biopolymer transporter ExbD [Chitinispirillaceae bacterium]
MMSEHPNNADQQQQQAFPATKRAKKATSRDVEMIDLDVTPVMNLFMVLIPFLVSMAVFTHVAVVDFSLPPAQTEGGAAEESKELDISIIVTSAGFRIVGTGKKLDIVPRVQGQYQFDKLRVLLKAIKFEYPSQKSVVLVLESEIVYDDIIEFMDICRESQFPDIGLSGDIG